MRDAKLVCLKRLALFGILEVVRLVQQNQHGHGRMPSLAALETSVEALQGCCLPRIEAVKLHALIGLEAHVRVVPGNCVKAKRLGVIKKSAMIPQCALAEGVVEPHRIGPQAFHERKIVATLRTPLHRVANLSHVLRREAVVATHPVQARQRAVSDTLQWSQWRHILLRDAWRFVARLDVEVPRRAVHARRGGHGDPAGMALGVCDVS
mmetsp:Transcript_125738/g.361485  ORF Transcript_125738/g.361485 Transcript_125738/m.361485 type:complete len:208 (+) Transcript_125738:1099-1722(+)